MEYWRWGEAPKFDFFDNLSKNILSSKSSFPSSSEIFNPPIMHNGVLWEASQGFRKFPCIEGNISIKSYNWLLGMNDVRFIGMMAS